MTLRAGGHCDRHAVPFCPFALGFALSVATTAAQLVTPSTRARLREKRGGKERPGPLSPTLSIAIESAPERLDLDAGLEQLAQRKPPWQRSPSYTSQETATTCESTPRLARPFAQPAQRGREHPILGGTKRRPIERDDFVGSNAVRVALAGAISIDAAAFRAAAFARHVAAALSCSPAESAACHAS